MIVLINTWLSVYMAIRGVTRQWQCHSVQPTSEPSPARSYPALVSVNDVDGNHLYHQLTNSSLLLFPISMSIEEDKAPIHHDRERGSKRVLTTFMRVLK